MEKEKKDGLKIKPVACPSCHFVIESCTYCPMTSTCQRYDVNSCIQCCSNCNPPAKAFDDVQDIVESYCYNEIYPNE